MLGDWDLPSTLLRRSLQAGARLVPVVPELEPRLALGEGELQKFERDLLTSARADRDDSASRYLLPWVEDLATERLMETHVRPDWLLYGALALIAGAAFSFTRGWHWAALVMLILSTPLDLIAERLGKLRLRPIAATSGAKRLLWPLAGVALLALGWWQWGHEGGWGAMLAALVAAAVAQADRFERMHAEGPLPHWLFSRRNAIFAALPFAVFGAWTGLLVGILIYAGASFFLAQHLVHRLRSRLTPH
jgi:phytoene dehydrogenase-like protein